MHIIHSFNQKVVDEHTSRETGFFITNKKGNYVSLGKENFSHTQGLFFFDCEDWNLFKTIEDIRIDQEMSVIQNNLFNVQRKYRDGAEEKFNLFNDSMIYSIKNYNGKIKLELDFRPMFDFDDKGRIYTITQEDDFIIIKYEKYIDDSLSVLDKTRFMAIKGAKNFNIINEWIKKQYTYDARRKSKSEFYIYNALSIKVNKHLNLAFSFAKDKETAKVHAEKIFENREYLLNSYKSYVTHSFSNKDFPLSIAKKSLDDLLMSVDRKERSVGIFAGLPWFYQFWARDELISIKALLHQHKYYLVKSILFKYMHNIFADGFLPSRLPLNKGDVKSVDAIGWLFVRLKDYMDFLVLKKLLNEYLSVSEIITIKRTLEKTIQALAHWHAKEGFIMNNEQETWMDTAAAQRGGAGIEVQALFLAMIKLHNYIAGITRSKQLFKILEKDVKENVRRIFFNPQTGMLYDNVYGRLPKETPRPNMFLAYYIYPELLSKKEWKKAFDIVLNDLWLDWGGLSSIGHKSPLFKSEYTGTDDLSYHNGDSWYYVNNFAAIAMHRLDSNYYSKQIKRILKASEEEMLFSGFIGCCAELSSAKHMKSEGCLSQAWSAATFIELWHELHPQTQ
ncbi:MAG: hypothetical protein KKF46_08030 [Nanoarchaeota archaeon]|nr:hypothetical protein [Nanoarchaeota archaeon]MBU1322276.1 hypothetical protein [Nanoarchaeota archaeon]MBU1598029.1 hypothetical protein [Nanoarchaeota archaeon]MBU2441005.1 hypothetical protein [Nanoarchaeota archaeon]